jgi:hypothetical protein
MRDRGLDLLDTFEIGVSAGKGARVELRYGLGVWGIGKNEGWRVRLGQRSLLLREDSFSAAPLPFPASILLIPVCQSLGERWPFPGFGHGCGGALGMSCDDERPVWPNGAAAGAGRSEDRIVVVFIGFPTGESFSIGAELHLLVGFRVRLLPAQVADFAGGLFGWDLLDDD